ncbi:hypothetical protein [Fimbriiglobus ruber]|uniref:hypothetical protein n=1 Tax=Fimbriiglobus ruber TaxID=1908690 RepID=UPI00117AC60D|nr:hypothetical protein [Fimbriiglobus ruber]
MPPQHTQRRLKPEAIALLNGHHAWPKPSEFFRWLKETENLSPSRHWWKRLINGEPVPPGLVHGLVRFLSTTRQPPLLLSVADISECVPHVPLSVKSDGSPGVDVWRLGWKVLQGHLPECFALPPGTICGSDDIDRVAQMVLENLGRKSTANGSRLLPDQALARGECTNEIDWRSYAAWIRQFWERDPMSILLARVNGNVVGATIIFPIREKAYTLYRDGEISAYELTGTDFQRPSKWLHVQSITQVRPNECPGTRARSLAQGHCMLYQIAALSHPVDAVPNRPVFIAPAINPENICRSRTYGLREIGVTTPRPRCPLMELRPPDEAASHVSLTERITYRARNPERNRYPRLRG